MNLLCTYIFEKCHIVLFRSRVYDKIRLFRGLIICISLEVMFSAVKTIQYMYVEICTLENFN